jgi:hypothetical protein
MEFEKPVSIFLSEGVPLPIAFMLVWLMIYLPGFIPAALDYG